MGSQSRKQVYPYQYKANTVINNYICGGGGGPATIATTLGISVPDNILQMTGLWTRVILTFDPSEPVANQKILGFSVQAPNYGGYQSGYSFIPNASTVTNAQATGGVLDFSINLQALLPYIYYFPSSANYPSYFELSFMTPSLSYTATMNLWKADMIYTTLGIR